MREALAALFVVPNIQQYLNRPRVKPILIFAGLGILTSLARTSVLPPNGSETPILLNSWSGSVRLTVAIAWIIGVIIYIRPKKPTLLESLSWVILNLGFALLLTWADRPAAVLMTIPIVARYSLSVRQTVFLFSVLLVISVSLYLAISPISGLEASEKYAILAMLTIVTLSQGASTYAAFELLLQNESKQVELNAVNLELRSSQAERLQAAALEERAFISRELHDTLGHELAALRLEVQRARKLETKVPEPSAEVLEALEGALNRSGNALEQLQGVVSTLRTPRLDGTLFQELQDLIGAWPGQVKLHFTVPEPQLTMVQKLAFYRGVQEALTNAYKHAPAHLVEVQVNGSPEQMEIIVYNSKAPNPCPPKYASGKIGLQQLRDRFQNLGGSVDVEEQEDKFTICLTLPLQQ